MTDDDLRDPEILPQPIIDWQPTHPADNAVTPGAPRALSVGAVGVLAFGAFALGAFAVGAVAVGALAVGRLSVGSARFRRLEIDHLVVGKVSALRR